MRSPIARSSSTVLALAILVVGAAGCDGGIINNGGTGKDGGAGGAAGAGAGGATGRGGSTGSGGSTGRGGSTGAGGATGSGGSTGRGGSTGAGGSAGAGGSTGRGGSTGAGGGAGGAAGGGVPGSGAFPPSSTFYQDISGAPVDSESTMIMNALAASGWGSGLGIDVSFDIFTADTSVARRAFDSSGDDPDCDTAPVPLPPGGNVEGFPDYHCGGGDCHLLVYQGTRLYELYQADVSTGMPTGGTFTGSCLVVWDLTHDYWQPAAPPNFSRGDHCNGADAADMPMAPLILTADDVRSGTVKHAMRFTIPNGHIRADVYVHPATHIGGPTGGADQLPYGSRLRLRGDFDLSTISSAQGRAVALALQRYGMFLADGGSLFISATVDVQDVMNTGALRGLKATDFEMVAGGTRYRWSDYQCQRTVIAN